MKRSIAFATILLGLGLILAACGAPSATAAPTAVPTTAPTTVPTLPPEPTTPPWTPPEGALVSVLGPSAPTLDGVGDEGP